MLQRWTHLLASSATLVAILLGLARHWEVWAIAKRAGLTYLVTYGTIGVLLVLGQEALRAEPKPPRGGERKNGKRPGINGTDTADSV